MANNCALRLVATLGNGKRATMTCRFEATGAIDLTKMQDAVDAAFSSWYAQETLTPLFGQETLIGPFEGFTYERVLSPVTGEYYFRNTSGVFYGIQNGPGLDVVDPQMSPNIAHCVSLHTATPGKKGRGRLYYWPMSNANADESAGVIYAAAAGELVSRTELAANNFAAEFNPNTVEWIVHAVTDGTESNVLSADVDLRIDTQRRRLQRA